MNGTYDDDTSECLAIDRADALAMDKRLLARLRQADGPRADLLEAWVEFGRHGALWQMVHRKPSRSAT